ncbi:MAG: hypothetical protein DI551_08610 [Micavibrio aeruginosavorus]|uniref:Uncharacterized protein n=1 Tax=Micavibrio aeruginosavorus TaxID=349221 RepID=A0A2W5MXJ6_9BACT|nr:MAG: hypothetical protein DI551_08610 [Micavibrio aeruginosavorus]
MDSAREAFEKVNVMNPDWGMTDYGDGICLGADLTFLRKRGPKGPGPRTMRSLGVGVTQSADEAVTRTFAIAYEYATEGLLVQVNEMRDRQASKLYTYDTSGEKFVPVDARGQHIS